MKISIIIPIYRENNFEPRLKTLLKEVEGFDVEIIIVVGLDYGDNFSNRESLFDESGIKFIFSKKGRGVQLKAGSEQSKGDVLVFLHADTAFKKEQLVDIINNTGKYDYGAFRLKIDNESIIFRVIEFFVYLRTKIFKLPYGDQTIFIKKCILNKIGGISKIPLFEDVDLMLKCKKGHLKFFLSPYYSQTSDRRWQKNGVFKTTIKNIILLFLYLIKVNPDRLYMKYYG